MNAEASGPSYHRATSGHPPAKRAENEIVTENSLRYYLIWSLFHFKWLDHVEGGKAGENHQDQNSERGEKLVRDMMDREWSAPVEARIKGCWGNSLSQASCRRCSSSHGSLEG